MYVLQPDSNADTRTHQTKLITYRKSNDDTAVKEVKIYRKKLIEYEMTKNL